MAENEVTEVSQDVSNEVEAPEMDIDSSSDSLANDLFPDFKAEPEDEDTVDDVIDGATEDKVSDDVEEVAATRNAPQSWKKEMHETWAKLDPSVQDYVEQREKEMSDGVERNNSDSKLGRVMRDTMAPYQAMLQAQGVDEPRAVQALLNAHYKLTNSDLPTKTAYFSQLAQSYGIDIGSMNAEQPIVDPTVKALQDELNGIKHTISQSQQTTLNETKTRVAKDVEAFASDPAHQYFDEVSGDIVTMIQAGHELKDAYEKAVWANPVTRQKEIARLQQEQEQSIRTKAKQEAETARKAAASNVRNRDTRRAPQEPRASMRDLDSAMRETMREIKSRY